MSIALIRNLIFIVSLIYCSISDIKYKKISLCFFVIYFITGIILIILNLILKEQINIQNINKSIILGLLIILISILTNNGVGRADGLYFLINSLYVSFNINLYLLITGMYILFIISIFIYIKRAGNIKHLALPFLPCLLPYALWSFYAQYRI